MKNITQINVKKRREWISLVCSAIRSRSRGGNRIKIGIVGALGTGDLGDEAMLISLENELRCEIKDVDISCFTTNPAITFQYTGIRSKPLMDGFMANNIWHFLFRNIGKIESRLFRFLRRIFRINESSVNEYSMRIFYILYSLVTVKLYRSNIFKGLLGRNIRKHISDILELDVVIYQGGAYINSWNIKSRIYMYLFPAYLATKENKLVIASGLNIGPFNKLDNLIVPKILREFELIGFRDDRESRNIIKKWGGDLTASCHYSNDDAISLPCFESNKIKKEIFSKNLPYIALNIHYWMLGPSSWVVAKKNIASLIRRVEEQTDSIFVAVPMIFTDYEYKFDIAAIKEIFCESGLAEDKLFIPSLPLSINDAKCIYQYADLTIGTRHHSMVLSVSSGTPVIALVFDEYYHMKHKGVASKYDDLVLIVDAYEAFDSKAINDFLETAAIKHKTRHYEENTFN